MSLEETIAKIKELEDDSTVQNYVAQANARYILFNTGENKESFPKYTIDDNNLDVLAFHYLTLGCELAEAGNLEKAREPLQKAASILEYVHAGKGNQTELSRYYVLISALANYVSFQYSKSFVLINKTEASTVVSKLLGQFLARNYQALQTSILEIEFNPDYEDEEVSYLDDQAEAEARICEITVARSLNAFVYYLRTGNKETVAYARELLTALKEVTEIQQNPATWWIIRLLLLISDGFLESSLWNALAPNFNLEDSAVRNYVRGLTYQQPNPICELFITQRKALSRTLDQEAKGCVVSMPTSSGKTRIAELAILDACTRNPEGKVLYIAPFRSLAFEIELTLEKSLANSGISVSHLYGGSLYSKLDEKILEESQVIIATPEKAKAILRSDFSIIQQLDLVILDEGHLLGMDDRLVPNEMFYEELRYFSEKYSARFLLLSAVLPNSEDLAEWLTKSEESVFKENWRPSEERLGILEWTGTEVNLLWESKDTERPCFNPKFIVAKEQPLKPRQRKVRYFPETKYEAICLTAQKLSALGVVLIYTPQKRSIFNVADAYIKALKGEEHTWKNEANWRTFELACKETYGEKSEWLTYARQGILCHNADLHSDVRLPMERLMRDEPKVIIATSTLGQGVNLGVSTVIFTDIRNGQRLISARDFWNIAGRAGRAFVDHEGKILVAQELKAGESAWARKWKRNTIKEYFDKDRMDNAKSGILSCLKELKRVAAEAGADFSTLLELIAENKLDTITTEDLARTERRIGLLDDTLLHLHYLHTEETINYEWIENFFTHSLAYIQAKHEEEITGEEVVSLFKSRVKGIVKRVGSNRSKWMSSIRSGLPLDTDLYIEERLDDLLREIGKLGTKESSIDRKVELLDNIEVILKDLPLFESDVTNIPDIKEVRKMWMKGVELSSIFKIQLADAIIKKYTFGMPWVLNGISKRLRDIELNDHAEIIEDLSVLVEAGLPSIIAVKIHQAGIRSRKSATEIASGYAWDEKEPIKSIKRNLIRYKEEYKNELSKEAGEWLEILAKHSGSSSRAIKSVESFVIDGMHEKSEVLIPVSVNDVQYLVSPDLRIKEEVTNKEFGFSGVSNLPGVYFRYNEECEEWQLQSDNPYIKLKKTDD